MLPVMRGGKFSNT